MTGFFLSRKENGGRPSVYFVKITMFPLFRVADSAWFVVSFRAELSYLKMIHLESKLVVLCETE